MNVSVWDYQGKGEAYAQALAADPRFTLVEDLWDAQVVLADTDHPQAPPAPEKHQTLLAAAGAGARIVLYPHGGPPVLDYDGLRPPGLPVSCQFVSGEGHAEIYRRINHKFPVRVAGWSMTELREPSGAGPVEHLVFAPIHPWADGKTMLFQHYEQNKQAYEAFCAHPAQRKTIRLWGVDQAAGIEQRDPGHVYVEGPPFPTPPEETILSADAVISFGTFAYMSVALGVPTVMFGQDLHPCSDDGQVVVRHWDRYKDYLRYPACLGDAPLDDLFARDVSGWRRLFVGERFHVKTVRKAVWALKPNRVERRRSRPRGRTRVYR